MKRITGDVLLRSLLIGSVSLSLLACDNHPHNTHSHQTQHHFTAAIDITNSVFQARETDCASYANHYGSSASDVQEKKRFYGAVSISVSNDSCVLTSNNIPNHDFNDGKHAFVNQTKEVTQRFVIQRSPRISPSPTKISQRTYNGVMLNGVPIDLLSASCYWPSARQANRQGNVPIGCSENAAWLVDPLGPSGELGADSHHAHTQPNGSYHYHGNPNAMFDDEPLANGSPVIGFAADGFPIYGSYFFDETLGRVRKAKSGYTLKQGKRPGRDQLNPGGRFDGTYLQDWQFTNAGDLDACNGMVVDGQYGYYVTDQYPWILNCFKGTPDPSFTKSSLMGDHRRPGSEHRRGVPRGL